MKCFYELFLINEDTYELLGTLPNKGTAHTCKLEAVDLSEHQRNELPFGILFMECGKIQIII